MRLGRVAKAFPQLAKAATVVAVPMGKQHGGNFRQAGNRRSGKSVNDSASHINQQVARDAAGLITNQERCGRMRTVRRILPARKGL